MVTHTAQQKKWLRRQKVKYPCLWCTHIRVETYSVGASFLHVFSLKGSTTLLRRGLSEKVAYICSRWDVGSILYPKAWLHKYIHNVLFTSICLCGCGLVATGCSCLVLASWSPTLLWSASRATGQSAPIKKWRSMWLCFSKWVWCGCGSMFYLFICMHCEGVDLLHIFYSVRQIENKCLFCYNLVYIHTLCYLPVVMPSTWTLGWSSSDWELGLMPRTIPITKVNEKLNN